MALVFLVSIMLVWLVALTVAFLGHQHMEPPVEYDPDCIVCTGSHKYRNPIQELIAVLNGKEPLCPCNCGGSNYNQL